MNIYHRWYCRSGRWRRRLQETILPGLLRDVDLGDHVLEIGPGPGAATEWLCERTAHVTSVEIDRRLAARLKQRMDGSNVTVVEADATAMPLPDGVFSSALSFTMLHHVPYERQDALLAEAFRVLRPGGMFVGMDSTPSFSWNVAHVFDDRNPVDPGTFAERLASAGFRDPKVRVADNGGFAFRAKKPIECPARRRTEGVKA
ncbi:MAG: class I SAM-dependent methyltransferase [Dehalococcoidia bacterium]|nr:class I SAM-dependent methyltransferase [Dehalococcoidia bacterium]